METFENTVHDPVLLGEVLHLAACGEGQRWVDCTAGFGGHASALAAAGAVVWGLDQDPQALAAARRRLEAFPGRFHPVRANFREVAGVVPAPVDGILADIGVSSWQLDQAARGFSFSAPGPVDMRMDPDGPVTALDLLRERSVGELTALLAELGEEPFAHRIAVAAKAWALGDGPHDTAGLARVVQGALPRRVAAGLRHHPATRTFQALRIAVNDELGALDALLASAPALLAPGGRFLVISFHSLEDRRVKTAFASLSGRRRPQPPRRGLPPPPSPAPEFELLTPHAVQAGEAEVSRNVRARSARLRAIRRLPVPIGAMP